MEKSERIQCVVVENIFLEGLVIERSVVSNISQLRWSLLAAQQGRLKHLDANYTNIVDLNLQRK